MTDNLNSVDALSHYYFILLPKFFCQIKKEKMIDNKLYQRLRHYQLFKFFFYLRMIIVCRLPKMELVTVR